jgi:hypothetical protein
MKIILSILVILFTWADVGLTYFGVHYRRREEYNSLWRPFVNMPVLFTFFMTLFWGMVLVLFYYLEAPLGYFTAFLCARIAVVVWNITRILRAR